LINQDGNALLQQSQDLSVQGRDFNLVLNALLACLQRLATIQLVPDLEISDEINSEQLTELSSKISPEAVQLLYQIALHGKRDLPFAADPKSGFEMTLLRMLSFQPKHIDSSTMDETVSSPTVERKPVSQVNVETQGQTTPPVKETFQVKESTPEIVTTKMTIPVVNDSALSANNWTATIANLKLAALSRQLADNSAFIKFEDSKLTLSIAPELAHLATDKTKDRLESALKQYLNTVVSVVIEQDAVQHQASQTLATQQAEQRTNRQQQAADSIHNDPAVNAIKQAFNGQVIESTIKPVD